MAALLLASAMAEIMPPKGVFNWKKLFRFKRRWFNNFQRRPSRRATSMPHPDIDIPHASCEKPNQERVNQITRSVGGLSNSSACDPIIPVMILDKGNGSYCLLFASSYVNWSKARSYMVNLPETSVFELPSCAERETQFPILDELATFATFSIKPKFPYHPIEFGQDVTMNQLLYLFDFRHNIPWVEKGTVTFADDMHFIFDAKPMKRYMEGALAFDEAGRLVGIIFGHVGSNMAIQISYLRQILEGMIPAPESIGHGGGAGGFDAGASSSSGGSSSRVSRSDCLI